MTLLELIKDAPKDNIEDFDDLMHKITQYLQENGTTLNNIKYAINCWDSVAKIDNRLAIDGLKKLFIKRAPEIEKEL